MWKKSMSCLLYTSEIWTQGYMTKNSTYHWLSGKLALPEKETHVAMFSTYRCRETIRLANELLEERKEMEKKKQKGKPKGETKAHDNESHGTRYVSASGL